MKRYLPTASVIFAGFFWGIMPLFVRGLGEIGLSAMQICSVRLVGAAITVFAALAVLRPSALRINWRDVPLLAVLGLVGMLLMSGLYFTAITLTTASVAAILLYTSPIFILVFSCIFFKERFTRRKLLALLLAFFGCVLVSGIADGGSITPLGFFIGLGSGIAYASYSLFGRVALARYSSVTVSAYAFAFAALGAVFFLDLPSLAASVGGSGSIPLTVFALIALCLVSGVAPAVLYTYGLSRMEAGRAGILVCVEPMTATFISVAVYHEECSLLGWCGMLMILFAILLLNFGKSQAAPEGKETP